MALLSAQEMAGMKGEEIVHSVARLRAKIADERNLFRSAAGWGVMPILNFI